MEVILGKGASRKLEAFLVIPLLTYILIQSYAKVYDLFFVNYLIADKFNCSVIIRAIFIHRLHPPGIFI